MSYRYLYQPRPLLLQTHSPKNSTPSLCFFFNKQKQTHQELKLIRNQKLLKNLSTFAIGGPCNYFIQVFNPSHLLSAIRYCNEHCINYMILGKGSNCLFDDLGYNGCVILNRIEFLESEEPGIYRVGTGFRLNALAIKCSNEGFSGLEFAGGIPGTVGGAAFMNAGAHGQEISDAIDSVEIITKSGAFQTFIGTKLEFGYRYSSLQDMNDLAAIVAVTFRLNCSESARSRQEEYLKRRRMSQPLREKSAGSVFRNPVGFGVSAGELIYGTGLKGLRVGGAVVSNIHANFFINSGGSTSQDMLNLISLVKEKVDQKFGVELTEEVLYVHPFS